MKMYFDCIHCFVRQTLDAVRLFTDNEEIHEQLLRKVLSEVSTMDFYQSPPAIAQGIHRMIRKHLGEYDPYRRIKDRCNYSAMKLYPELKMRIEQASDSFEMAVRYAIAGNIIDFGVHSQIDDAVIHDTLDRAVRVHIPANSLGEFRNAVELADEILYLGDNAGEIVFDRLLIEQLPCEKVTYAVRGNPIIKECA